MKRILAVMLAGLAWSCTYDPSLSLTCTNEGEVDGERRCEGGVWITRDAGMQAPDAAQGGDDTSSPDATSCVPETDEAFCARFGLTCDDVSEVDTCGNPRTVNCGTCTGSATCGGGGTPNVCACPSQTDIDFCASYDKTCDPFTAVDECGAMRTVNCGACAGLLSCGSDNLCECEPVAACAALGKNCGSVAVTGQCGSATMIECGSCDPNGACGGDNVCACNDGFTGDGVTCTDVDECADQTDNCDPNATCTNNTGGFECACGPGYVGDGRSCTLDALVKAVHTVTVTLPDSDASEVVTIPTVDAAQTVLFVSRRLTDTDDEIDRLGANVYLSGNDEITVTRDDHRGTLVVVVSAVEFDPTLAVVQSGTFSNTGTNTSVTLPTAVDQSKSFLVFTSLATDNTSEREDLFVAGSIAPAGDQLNFVRDADAGDMNGYWWVVESVGTTFSVQHVSSSINGSNTSRDVSISSVTTAKSMLLYSWSSDQQTNHNATTHVSCRLETSTNVECRRYDGSGMIPQLDVQVVSFTTSPMVYRGTASFATDAGMRSPAIGNTVADATAFGGVLGVTGAAMSDTTSGTEIPGGFFTQEISAAGDQIELRRGTPRDSDADVDWQVIDW